MSFAFGRGRGSIIVALAALLAVSFTTAGLAGEETPQVPKDPWDVVSAKREIIRKALLARSRSLESVLLVCGDSAPDPGETCDDGNTAPGDGCSATCQIEPGWECTLPVDTTNAVADGSLEQGSPNPDWAETGTVFDPICSNGTCGGPAPYDGAWFAWFGGVAQANDQTLTQVLTIPAVATTLEFQLWVGVCDSLADVLEVEIDGNVVYSTSPCAVNGGYTTQIIDLATAPLGPYNDGLVHTLVFHSSTFAANLGNTNYFVDAIEILEPLIPPIPSACDLAGDTCFLEEFENGLGVWTTFEVGAALVWGTTDDGVCGTVNWTVGNYTDGPGEAACIDSDAAGPTFGVVDSYLCSPPVDLSSASGAAVDFLYNYQIFGGPTAEDLFEVLVGVVPPAPPFPSYTSLLSRMTNAGALVGPGASESLSLAAFEGSPTVYICLRYGADFDWYAQVDSFSVNAGTCDGSPPLETSPPGAVEPFTVDRSSTEANQLDLSWEFTPGAASYRIIAGDLDSLQGAGGVTVVNAAPIACGIVGLSVSLPEPVGSKFLLVAAEGPGGVGPLGSGLPPTPRTASTTCP